MSLQIPPTARVGYLLKKFPRLSETFVLGELLAQEGRGGALHVFSRRRPDDEPRHPQLARLTAEVEVLPSARRLDPWGELFGGDEDRSELLARTEAVVRRARPWGNEKFSDLLAEALHLLRRTRELGVEHLHVHFATDAALVAWILRELGGPSYSITAHAKDIYRETVRWDVLDVLVGGAAFVVTVCDANVRHMRERLSPASAARVRRLYNGIDLAEFSEPGGAPRQEDHVLSVGRLVPKKGFDVLVEAFAEVLRQRPSARLTLVGDGEERPALEARVHELGLTDHVRLAGALDQDAVRALMREATVFGLPCVVGEDGNRDALPTVLLEALASGLPCVSTPVTGIPEILDGGAAGRLVPESDVAATADALLALLADPAERARIAARGRVHAEVHFDRSKAADVLGSWFDEALAERTCASPA